MSKRSIIIDGTTTSVFLEEAFWEEVDRRSKTKGIQWYDLVREMLATIEDPKNRSSSIKESLLRSLRSECDKAANQSKVSNWKITGQGKTYSEEIFGHRIVIGRGKDCDIVVGDQDVSRKHALMAFDGKNWWIIDTKSKNGVFINGKQVESSQVSSGDKIGLGHTIIELE